MTRPPNHMYKVSERLSEVMDDIGVNERLVMKRRKAYVLMENIRTLSDYDNELQVYHFGSQSEGSTTLGLNSDMDTLLSKNTHNIIQNMSEHKPGVVNLMMRQNKNITPGYCHLQLIRSDLPLPTTVSDINYNSMETHHYATDSDGGVLAKNTLITYSVYMIGTSLMICKINGPALTTIEEHGLPATDTVICCCCESSPHQVTSWLQKQRGYIWPTEDVWNDCRKVGCFVVPVESKVSYEPELEWRISTSLQERYLMFSLNITQLRCYVLMKMVLKTYIDPHVEDVLSSFMCKNVLWYCIDNSSHDWHTGNLLSYLRLCLFMLKECVEQRNCPHLMITENNLLAGHMADTQRGKLLDIISHLMKVDEQFLYEIQMDDLGIRLKMRLSMISISPNFPPSMHIQLTSSGGLVFQTADTLSKSLYTVLGQLTHESLETAQQDLLFITSRLERDQKEGDFYQNIASELLTPLMSSTLGSVLACTNIDTHRVISGQAFTYLEAGKESDALSGRLKLVSVLYCTGDMERAESELRIIETQYNIPELQTLCGCVSICHKPSVLKLKCLYICGDYNEAAIKSHLAFCTRFLQCEINCVPHELRYEILRYYSDKGRQMRTYKESCWMDNIVVDSIPYLFFLQYKTYGLLQRRTEQQIALSNLAGSIFEPGIGHKETALNLLGQCMEQENRQIEAFLCYIRSLQHRIRNNAARLLLLIQLFKLWKQPFRNAAHEIVHVSSHACIVHELGLDSS